MSWDYRWVTGWKWSRGGSPAAGAGSGRELAGWLRATDAGILRFNPFYAGPRAGDPAPAMDRETGRYVRTDARPIVPEFRWR